MKLFLYALMTTFLIVGCESYQRDEGVDIQKEEAQEEKTDLEPIHFPDKGGNAGNK